MLALWYAKEKGLRASYDRALVTVKNFGNSYIYVKKCEEDYGQHLKLLCQKVDSVFRLMILVWIDA
jgi:hypothetical protein